MKSFLNLLPWKCRKAQLVRLRLVQWSVAWAAVGGLVLAACLAKWDHCGSSRDEAERLEQAYAPTSALLAEIKTLGRRAEQLRARKTVLAQLESSRPALTLLGFVSQSARECEGRLRVEQVTLHCEGTADKTASPASPAAGPAAATSVTIKGIAADNLAVARFVLALRQTRAFDRVELKSSQEQPAHDHPADRARRTRSYLVECGY